MFLAKPLLALLGTLVFAAGYSMPGGYERMMLYYAYLIDSEINGGSPKTFATKCKKCDLNQFIKYIAANPPSTVSVTTVSFPDMPPLESTARSIFDNDLATPINVGRANELLDSGDTYDRLLARTGEWLAGKIASGKAGDTLNEGARNALDSVLHSRMEASGVSFFQTNPALTEKWTDVPLYQDSEKTAKLPDLGEVAKASGKPLKEVQKAWKKCIEGGHQENIKVLKMYASMARGC